MALLNLGFRYKVEFSHSYEYLLKYGEQKVELFAYKNSVLHLVCKGTR